MRPLSESGCMHSLQYFKKSFQDELEVIVPSGGARDLKSYLHLNRLADLY